VLICDGDGKWTDGFQAILERPSALTLGPAHLAKEGPTERRGDVLPEQIHDMETRSECRLNPFDDRRRSCITSPSGVAQMLRSHCG